MANLITVIWTNGVVQSTYDDGRPAELFSGRLPVLSLIFYHYLHKELLPSNEKIMAIKFYITNDNLCTPNLEVSAHMLKHLIPYLQDIKLNNNESANEVDNLLKDLNNLNDETGHTSKGES
jgi:hypothetical protein